MEVHPPEHPIHTWREFLIHMGTICLGLLIAIGLEQFAEFLHHRHQLHTLREALHEDNEKALTDDKKLIEMMQHRVDWLDGRLVQVQHALHSQQPLSVSPRQRGSYVIPGDPAWKAAKLSNLVDVMPQDEIKAYSEIDELMDHQQAVAVDHADSSNLNAFELQFKSGPGPDELDFSSATRADLLEYERLLSLNKSHSVFSLSLGLYMQGALESVLNGEYDMYRINQAENQSYEKH